MICRTSVLLISLLVFMAQAQSWTFAVASDPQGDTGTFQSALREMRDMQLNPTPAFPKIEALVLPGDLSPGTGKAANLHYRDYLAVFKNTTTKPAFIPAVGNHELSDNSGSSYAFIRDSLIPRVPQCVRQSNQNCTYYVDMKNVRFIMVDPYRDLGSNGCINSTGRTWVEQSIVSAPASIDHIFVVTHEPAFPRYRHIGDSFDACKTDRDAFWNMLTSHRKKVRAMFVGHTHHYDRMRVDNPASTCANTATCFPNEANGIYQINDGTVGNDSIKSFVEVQVDGQKVSYRVLLGRDGATTAFAIVDTFSSTNDQPTSIQDAQTPRVVQQHPQRRTFNPIGQKAKSSIRNTESHEFFDARGRYFFQFDNEQKNKKAASPRCILLVQ